MTFDTDVVVAGLGEYGPMSDGSVYPWADLATSDGQSIGRAMIGGRGVEIDPKALPFMARSRVTLSLEQKDSVERFRLRIVAVVNASRPAAQAA